MSKRQRYNQTHKDEARWTNSMFGGMPTVTINKVTKKLHQEHRSNPGIRGRTRIVPVLSFWEDSFFFLLGVNPWISVLGAVTITFCSYNFQIIKPGMSPKMIALAYVPWVLASLAYAYRKHALTGALFCTYHQGCTWRPTIRKLRITKDSSCFSLWPGFLQKLLSVTGS